MTLTLARSFPTDLKSCQEPEKAGSVTVPTIPTKTSRLRQVKELLLGLPASECQLGGEARCAQQHQVLSARWPPVRLLGVPDRLGHQELAGEPGMG